MDNKDFNKDLSYTLKKENDIFQYANYAEEYDTTAILDYINDNTHTRSFGDGLSTLIYKKYGKNLYPEDFLRKQAEKNNIKLNRTTISNWFNKARPKKGDQSREHMYKIAFALELDLEETNYLFTSIYLDKPFNLRDPKEFIYYCCIKNNYTYETAEELIASVNGFNNPIIDATIGTHYMKSAANSIIKGQDIVDYIKEHPHNFSLNMTRAKETLNALLSKTKITDRDKELITSFLIKSGNRSTLTKKDSCKELTSKLSGSCAKDIIENKDNMEIFFNKNLTSISTMLNIILDMDLTETRKSYEKTIFNNINLPNEIKNRFPTKHTFSTFLSGDECSYEELRKMIILLFSYNQWLDNTGCHIQPDFDSYYMQLNLLLDDTSLPPLYYGNPYDWLFMYCTLCQEPLETFREIIATAIESIDDIE